MENSHQTPLWESIYVTSDTVLIQLHSPHDDVHHFHDDVVQNGEEIHHYLSLLSHLTQQHSKGSEKSNDSCRKKIHVKAVKKPMVPTENTCKGREKLIDSYKKYM